MVVVVVRVCVRGLPQRQLRRGRGMLLLMCVQVAGGGEPLAALLLLLEERRVHILVGQPLVLWPWHRQCDCVCGRRRVATDQIA